MSLMKVHRAFVVTVMLGCLAFIASEIAHAPQHSTGRTITCVALPGLFIGVLAVYLRMLLRQAARERAVEQAAVDQGTR